MAQYPFCSGKQILARLIRNTGGKLPSAYHDDILEWMPEVIDMLCQTNTVTIKSTPSCGEPKALWATNHLVCLPSDRINIIAVEDQYGRRIPEAAVDTDLSSPTQRYISGSGSVNDPRATVFSVNPLNHQTADGTPTTQPGSTVPVYGEDVTNTSSTNNTSMCYKLAGNYMQTSFQEGFVKIHYYARVLDESGYPMIPDNENFKSACAWYILSMLIGAGYEHKVFSFRDCEAQFEKYAARAAGEIGLMSPETMAKVNRVTVRLIEPFRFYEDFFTGAEQPEIITKRIND
jgi:hypothetical protein